MRTWDRRSGEAGNALIELAVALPLLVAIIAGTVDFARIFNRSISLTNAARAGAQWGAYSLGRSGDVAGMISAATAAIPDVSGATALASRDCVCATNAGVFSNTTPAHTCTGTCAVGHIVTTVTVTASTSFTTIMNFLPGVPTSINLNRAATMRVAN